MLCRHFLNRLLNMFPGFATNNIADNSLVNTILLTELFLAYFLGSVTMTYFYNLILFKFCEASLLASGYFFWMSVREMLVTTYKFFWMGMRSISFTARACLGMGSGSILISGRNPPSTFGMVTVYMTHKGDENV